MEEARLIDCKIRDWYETKYVSLEEYIRWCKEGARLFREKTERRIK